MPSTPRAPLLPGWSRFPDPESPGCRWLGAHPGFALSHFHAYERPLPGFPALTHVNEGIAAPGHRLGAHRHPEWEILYVVDGAAELVASGRRYRVAAGDVFITRPDEIHHGRPEPGRPFHDCAVGFDPARLPLAGLLPATVPEGAASVGIGLFGSHVVHAGPALAPLYRRMLAELDAFDGDPARRSLGLAMVQALLVELFVAVMRAGLAQAAPPAPRRADLRALLGWIATRLDDPPGLPEMAARIGLSPAHLVAVCRAELGRSPAEQVAEMRIAEACRRLAAADTGITAVAHALGFCSSQHFSTVFRRHRGCSPSAWRRR